MTIHKLINPFLFVALALFMLSGYAQQSSEGGNINKSSSPSLTEFTLYKNPQCSCCERWAEHMEKAGFQLQIQKLDDLSGIKREFGIPLSQQSCHTAVWKDGQARYVFEGHIPAALVQRFLDNPPENAKGLLVPGMPVGSPGMEYGDMRMPYDVLLLNNDGTTEVYAHIDADAS